MPKQPASKTSTRTSSIQTSPPAQNKAAAKLTAPASQPAAPAQTKKQTKPRPKIVERNTSSAPAPKKKRSTLPARTPTVEEQFKQLIQQVETHGKAFRGRTNFMNFLQGKALTRNQAIEAFCYTCCGYFSDGRFDCKVLTCPLYAFSPCRGAKESPTIES